MSCANLDNATRGMDLSPWEGDIDNGRETEAPALRTQLESDPLRRRRLTLLQRRHPLPTLRKAWGPLGHGWPEERNLLRGLGSERCVCLCHWRFQQLELREPSAPSAREIRYLGRFCGRGRG